MRYRPDIDGLRAVAILMVVGYHADVVGFAGGFVGVDVFFVISGFVILGVLRRELDERGHVNWAGFYARRFRRLVPAAVLMLVVTLALGWLLLDPLGDQQMLARGAIAAATSTSNFYFLDGQPVDYFTVRSDAQAYLHTWSLSVEEQFYAFLPILFALGWLATRVIGRGRRATTTVLVAVMTLASLIGAIWLAHGEPQAGFFLPMTRGYEFGAGALLALAPVPRAGHLATPVSLLAAAVVAGTLVVALPSDGFPGAWGLIPTVATTALIWAGMDGLPAVNRLLATRPAVGIGKVSYGWYLWHWPLLAIATAWNLRELPLLGRLAVMVAALAIAALSHRYLELRFRHPRRRQDLAGQWRTSVVAVSVLALTAIGAHAFGAWADQKARSAEWTAVSQPLKDAVEPPEACTHGALHYERAGTPCHLTDYRPDRPTVVLWGDSHARMYIPSLQEAGRDRGVNLVSWTLASCPPFLPADPDAGSLSAPTQTLSLCEAHNTAAAQWITSRSETVRVVLAARWPLYRHQAPDTTEPTDEERAILDAKQRRVQTQLPQLLDELAAAGIGTDLVAPTPSLWRPAPYCLARRWFPFDCGVPRDAAELQVRDSVAFLSAVRRDGPRGIGYIDITDLLCDDHWCAARRDGHTLYHDSHHLTVTTARRAAPLFAPTIAAALAPRVGR